MKQKSGSFLHSLWFLAVVSLVSVSVLVDKTITVYSEGKDLLGLIIWTVIAFHFVRATHKAWVTPRGGSV